MTRKQKPQTASKKRAPTERKAVKAVTQKKQAPIREKERARAAAAKKPEAHPPVERAKSAEIKVDAKAATVKGGAKPPVEKKMLGIERRVPVMPEERQSQLKLLIARGKDQGYLTLRAGQRPPALRNRRSEQIEDIVNTINDMGIPVYEKAPDTEALLAAEPSAPADEEAIEEAAAALAALDAELGRTRIPCACTCARWAR